MAVDIVKLCIISTDLDVTCQKESLLFYMCQLWVLHVITKQQFFLPLPLYACNNPSFTANSSLSFVSFSRRQMLHRSLFAFVRGTNKRTNEVYLPMNRVNNDRLPVKTEAHQSWPPKKTKKNDRVTTQKRQKKRKRKNTLLYIK